MILSCLRKSLLIFASLLCFVLPTSYAEPIVKIAFNNAQTPYSIEKTENDIEVEIVREALRRAGYQLKPVFASPERKKELFETNEVDGITATDENSVLHANFSRVYVIFQDVAVTLKSRDLAIRSIKDLEGLKVSGYEGARSRLGSEFEQFATDAPLYSEERNQFQQIRSLNDGQVDAIIADRTIFMHLNRLFGKSAESITYHTIFPKVTYRIGFRSAALRNKFNDGLKKLDEADMAAIYARHQDVIRFRP